MQKTHILSPLTIRSVDFRNRIIMPSMVTHYAGRNGEITEKLLRYHEARALGGVGLNLLESTSVHDSGRCYFPGVSIASDEHIKGLKKLTDCIHNAGGKAGIQLNHAGRLVRPDASGQAIPLVSFVPGRTPLENSRVLDEEDIHVLIQAFGQAARRAKEAGFDVIEIHGAHGYLIAQFMSPLFNRREDSFGGSYENRMRFALEVLRATRKAAGEDMALFFRISSQEFLPGGIDMDLSCRIAQSAAEAGADLIHISAGLSESNEYTGPPPCLPKGWNADQAARIRSVLAGTALTSVAGRIVDRASADAILSAGKSDMVTMGRALIADPNLPRKLAEGHDADIVPCVGCNEGCNSRLGQRLPMECAVNPAAGREALTPRSAIPLTEARRIAVIGGGPTGMEAALTAARRGHHVTLYEQKDRLGGLLNAAMLPPHKDILGTLRDYYIHALAQAGVTVRMGQNINASTVAELKADVVLVATGSEAVRPGFAAQPSTVPVLSAEEALRSAPLGERMLILGGGMVGCETAEALANAGKDVTILELRDALAPDMHARARKFLLREFQQRGVKVLLESQVLSITEEGRVLIKDKYGNESCLPPCDVIILALGYRPRVTLSRELTALGVPFIPLGDCVRPGRIMDAIHAAHSAANAL